MLDPGLSGGLGNPPARIPDGRSVTASCEAPGASTGDGYPEHSFAWDTTLRTRLELTAAGVRSAMTRGDDDEVGPCDDERASMADALEPSAAAVVSIQAYSGPASERGFVVLYARPGIYDMGGQYGWLARSEISWPLRVSRKLRRATRVLVGVRMFPCSTSRKSSWATWINQDDAAMMKSPDGRQDFADAVAQGIKEYLAQPG